ncbi:MAG: O-antigen ligase family protein [Clostridia bacterium]|nr:O-antigen ligase family protein [Clostridia bacterium]
MRFDFSTVLQQDTILCENAKPLNMGKGFKKVEGLFTKLWNSYYYFFGLFIVAVCFMFLQASVVGIAVMGVFLSINLIFCEDILATTLPFLLMILMTVQSYKDLSVYAQDAWVGVLVIVCLVAHLIIYAKPIRIGRSFLGLCLVTLATAMGGVGTIASEEYFSPLSLYYTYGLGLGMLLVYVIVKSQSYGINGPSPLKKFGRVLYVTGMFAAFMVFLYYYQHPGIFDDGFAIPFIAYRNYLSSVLLITMCVPCYYAIRSDMHILSILFMYCAMIMTGSRSGLFFGAMLLLGCIVYLFKYNKKKRRVYFMVLLVAGIPFVIMCFSIVQALFSARFVDGTLIYWQDSRISFFERALADFFKNPFFGVGLGYQGNADIFVGVPGSMVFYHNYVAQIIGSMGCLGILAYSVLMYDRLSILTKRFSARTATFIMGYAGIFLMSMTNPGEFSPLPYEMLAVMIFTLIESEPIVERNPNTGRRLSPEKVEDYINGIM